MIEIVIVTVLAFYAFIGVIFWIIGLGTFGGRKRYKLFLKDEFEVRGNRTPIWLAYYVIFAAYVLLWPVFLKRKK